MRPPHPPFLRAVALALLGAAFGCASEPPVKQVGVLDGREPTVRVYLRSLDPWTETTLAGKGGLRVKSAAGDVARPHPVALARSGEKGLRIDGAEPVTAATFAPMEGSFTLAGKHGFSGTLEWRDGKLVNHVTMENYVLGVLRGELPVRGVAPDAAGAQAIAVRSYTLHYLARNERDFDLDDTTLFQRYVGLRPAPEDDHLRAGVRATTGLYLAYDGVPLKAYYHSTCGGHTTDAPTGLNRDGLRPMKGVHCEFCRDTRYWRWEATLKDDEVVKAAALTGRLRSVEVVERGPGERASRVRVTTDAGERAMHANDFRLAVGPSALRSTNILGIERAADGITVRGGGWGHGVGLCQLGAMGMAKRGHAAEAIAGYYYPGALVKRAY